MITVALNRTPNAVLAGTGYLYYGELADGQTPEPAPANPPEDVSTDPGGNYEGLGFTDAGANFEWDQSSEDIVVAESATPIRTLWTEITYRLVTAAAQFEPRILKLALNGGTIDVQPGSPAYRSFTPPDLGDDKPVTLLFRFTNEFGHGSDLYVPLGKNTSTVSIPFARAPQKSVTALSWEFQAPPSGPVWKLSDYVGASVS